MPIRIQWNMQIYKSVYMCCFVAYKCKYVPLSIYIYNIYCVLKLANTRFGRPIPISQPANLFGICIFGFLSSLANNLQLEFMGIIRIDIYFGCYNLNNPIRIGKSICSVKTDTTYTLKCELRFI